MNIYLIVDSYEINNGFYINNKILDIDEDGLESVYILDIDNFENESDPKLQHKGVR